MKFDLEKTFSYAQNDPCWIKKCLIGSSLCIPIVLSQIINSFIPNKPTPEIFQTLIIFLPFIAVLAIITLLCSIFTWGFYIKNVNIRIKNPESMLPEWKWKELFILGIKAVAGVFVYLVFMFGVNVMLIMSAARIGVILMIVLSILWTILFLILLSLGFLSFTTDTRFVSFFDYGKMKKMIVGNVLNYILFVVIILAINIMVSIVFCILMATIIGLVVAPFIIFYQSILMSDIVAQFIRTSPEYAKMNVERL